MANISPFRGLRPRSDLVSKIVSPPYDVLDSDEARALASGNPLSFLHVAKPEIDLDPGIDLYDERVYRTAKENFNLFLEKGYYTRDAKPSLYLYRLSISGHSQTGIVGGASVREYETDLIKKHELTRADKEKDRTTHTETLRAHTGPVFLAYRQSAEIDSLVEKVLSTSPAYDVTTYDGVRNELWVIDTPEALAHAFRSVPCLYIADGHHRAASYSKTGAKIRDANPQDHGDEDYNSFLAVIFPHNQLRILPYNRVVHDLNGLSPDAFVEKVREKFTVGDGANPSPSRRHLFSMFLDGRWLSLVPKPGTWDEKDPVGNLDVSILQSNLLDPVLGIKDPRRDKRIDFVGGIRGTSELEKKVKDFATAVAFSLFPVTMEELFAISDAGQIMPPKSTWFEPKLKDGFVLKTME